MSSRLELWLQRRRKIGSYKCGKMNASRSENVCIVSNRDLEKLKLTYSSRSESLTKSWKSYNLFVNPRSDLNFWKCVLSFTTTASVLFCTRDNELLNLRIVWCIFRIRNLELASKRVSKRDRKTIGCRQIYVSEKCRLIIRYWRSEFHRWFESQKIGVIDRGNYKGRRGTEREK